MQGKTLNSQISSILLSFQHSDLILAIIYYLRVAWTNPGYIMGSMHDSVQGADAYD